MTTGIGMHPALAGARSRRYEAAYEWDIADEQYKWVYDRTGSGDFVPRDPAAPGASRPRLSARTSGQCRSSSSCRRTTTR